MTSFMNHEVDIYNRHVVNGKSEGDIIALLRLNMPPRDTLGRKKYCKSRYQIFLTHSSTTFT